MEKHEVIYTVPLHVGENIRVPSYAKVSFYDPETNADVPLKRFRIVNLPPLVPSKPSGDITENPKTMRLRFHHDGGNEHYHVLDENDRVISCDEAKKLLAASGDNCKVVV